MKPKVIFILENAYMFQREKFARTSYPGTPEIINIKNATYSRIYPYFKDSEFELWFGESTPHIATNPTTKFKHDAAWLKKVVTDKDWFAVISCCKKADDGLAEINFKPFMSLPHPVSFKWRKQMILDCVEQLKQKLNESNS